MKKGSVVLVGALMAGTVIALVLGGCGGGGLGVAPTLGGGSGGVSGNTWRAMQYHWLGPYPYGSTTAYYRWRDIVDNQYAGDWPSGGRDSFYNLNQIRVEYDDVQTTGKVSGTLVASGLKPNFALQLKLEGQPTTTYPGFTTSTDAGNWTNNQLGKVGRWWCLNEQWNVADRDLRKHSGHWILGYLVYDFFITDSSGTAAYPFVVNNSYHVLWRTDQRQRRAKDGPAKTVTVQGGPPYYAQTLTPKSASVYAESEPTRPSPGTLTLPKGNYKCRLLLTEETFHNVPPALASTYTWGRTNYADGGFWAHALTDEGLIFTIQ